MKKIILVVICFLVLMTVAMLLVARKIMSNISNYDNCVTAGGDVGVVGLNTFCSIGGQTYNVPHPILSQDEKRCGDFICKKLMENW